jgi:hypothetical protein
MRFSTYDLLSICFIIVLALTLTIQDAYDGGCHDPDFSRIKNFIMHSWHIAYQSLFQSFEPYSFKEYCFNAFFPNFGNKRFSERKYFKNELHYCGAILYSYIDVFLLKTK